MMDVNSEQADTLIGTTKTSRAIGWEILRLARDMEDAKRILLNPKTLERNAVLLRAATAYAGCGEVTCYWNGHKIEL